MNGQQPASNNAGPTAPEAPSPLTSPAVIKGSVASKPSSILPTDVLARCMPYPAYVLVPAGGFINATDSVIVQPTVLYVPAEERKTEPPSAETLTPFYPGGPLKGLQAPDIDLKAIFKSPLTPDFPNLPTGFFATRQGTLTKQLSPETYGTVVRYFQSYDVESPSLPYLVSSGRHGQLRAALPRPLGLTHHSPVVLVATPRSWTDWLVRYDEQISPTANTMSSCAMLCELDSLMPAAVHQLASSGQLQKFMQYLSKAPTGPNDLVACNWVENNQKYYRPWIPVNVTPATAATLMILDKGSRRAAGKMIAACPVPIIPEIRKLGDRGLIDARVLGYILKWGLAFSATDSAGRALRLNGLAEAVAQFLYDHRRWIGKSVVDDVGNRLADIESKSSAGASAAILDLDKPVERGIFHAVVLAGAFKFADRITDDDKRRNPVIQLAISCVGEVVAEAVPFGGAIIGPIKFAVSLISDNFINGILPPRDWAQAFEVLVSAVALEAGKNRENFLGGTVYTTNLVAAFNGMKANKSAYETLAKSISQL